MGSVDNMVARARRRRSAVAGDDDDPLKVVDWSDD